ncbi:MULTISPECIES: carbohydrate ABC transporter permease [Kosmotoga]|uniref:Binding-protein-dependent transport systems inner membrane component n=1 Tax=Kosmotoga olearia (strain ATCC BAA-1733 / DSM 21960 / TBF 19.5.1) TaxID=521045 RepID=C5CH53_KOSOT|nr:MULTISPECIES: carbohydrate ABC transporter permease [Kosmotoga]ACR80656.1 binding-protein-dependent transport systems inner membrane component [Kosmotoga olearia TBF 19.5.1]OAA19106.1 sugar ABC transporter permease [Kosmotoga sp. DU53]
MKAKKIVLYVLLFAFAITTLLPLVWTISTSLKTRYATLKYPPEFLPDEVSFSNYTTIFNKYPFGRFLFNSFLVTLSTVFLQVVVAAMAAYAFARFDFKYKELLFMFYIATLMFPFQVKAIPLYLIVRSFGWINTYQGLILPKVFSAFGVFLLRQSILSTPKDYDESAAMDGANRITIFLKIILPLNKGALATLTIFAFMDSWNDYLWPLIVTTTQEMMTIPLGLASLQGRWTTQWNLVSAGTVVSIIPILIVYIVAQKWFIEGISATGLKG